MTTEQELRAELLRLINEGLPDGAVPCTDDMITLDTEGPACVVFVGAGGAGGEDQIGYGEDAEEAYADACATVRGWAVSR